MLRKKPTHMSAGNVKQNDTNISRQVWRWDWSTWTISTAWRWEIEADALSVDLLYGMW